MSNHDEKLFNVAKERSLYCVWVSMRNHAGERLVAIWIDPAMTAFKSCAPEISDEVDRTSNHFPEQQEKDVHLSAGEHATCILPPHS